MASYALEQAPDELRLAEVGHVVTDDADEPGAERHRRVPALVHDPVQRRVVQRPDVAVVRPATASW